MELAAFCSSLCSFILIAISILHFYWAAGGAWGKNESVPTTEAGNRIFEPGILACFIVALGLLVLALVMLAASGLFLKRMPITTYASYGIAVVFFMRGIGDFHYVGIFKKLKTTPFAKNDTRYYSPLCFLISLLSIGAKL